MSGRRGHLQYSDDKVKTRTEAVLHLMVAQLNESPETTNGILLRKALRFRELSIDLAFSGTHNTQDNFSTTPVSLSD
ncbi:hypothetical protein THRCLA_22497 [Thraustotheca clavata]|uniref:Uncharacterized protein n=1 Tax=Thraustotheca clavata TaxID=74557 RepID=A0A1V9YYT2_9STRA|nr:hypothetical protein THRCLA_22497 [Thraustotheca clavata]